MVYTVTLNPSIDYVVQVDAFEAGQLNRVSRELFQIGGKGINVSVVLSRLGVSTTALGFVAGFTGCEIERVLSQEGVTTDFAHLETGISRINVKLKSEVETEINGRGPMVEAAALEDLERKLTALGKEDFLEMCIRDSHWMVFLWRSECKSAVRRKSSACVQHDRRRICGDWLCIKSGSCMESLRSFQRINGHPQPDCIAGPFGLGCPHFPGRRIIKSVRFPQLGNGRFSVIKSVSSNRYCQSRSLPHKTQGPFPAHVVLRSSSTRDTQ